jgi:glucosylceramidase
VCSVGAVVLAVSASSAVGGTSPISVHVWLTTTDGAYKMSDMGTIEFGDAPPSAPTVVIDPSRDFQTMAGFGGAITDSSAVVL